MTESKMTKWRHEVIECGQGARNLRLALAAIDATGKEVVSVIPNTGGGFMSAFSSGDSYGLLIVVRTR